MMKRLLCLMLCLLMVVPLLASCKKDEDALESITDDASRYTKTLSMWIIAEEGMDPDQAAAVNEAINKITKRKFKTQVIIKYLTEAEYYEKLEKAFVDHEAALEEAKKNGTTLSQDVGSQETVLDEYGVPQLKYPEIYDFQVDILLVTNAQKYYQYIENEWIVGVDGLLENNAVELTSYISKVLSDSSKYYGAAYGVPNNSVIGEYTYLAVDEALANEYLATPEDFGNSIYSDACYRFLSYVYNRTGGEKVYPIYSADGTVALNNLHYWSYDLDSSAGNVIPTPDQFSLFGGFYENSSEQGSELGYGNLLTNPVYAKNLQKKIEYEKTGKDTTEVEDDFITTDPNAKAAIRIVKGGWETAKELEDAGYTVLTAEAPRATDADVFGSMFCIGSHSSDEGRAMEIIAYLNTNAEFRNLLQYGIENENYTLHTVNDAAGKEHVYVRETETNKYKMSLAYTGNMFIAYPDSAANVMAWEYGKMQNLDAKAYPTTGLFFNLKDYKLNTKSIRVLDAVSKAFETHVLSALTTPEAVQILVNGKDATGAQVTDSYATKYNTDAQGMAAFLLSKLQAAGISAVSYTDNGVTKDVTQADLASALACMRTGEIDETKDALQSPNALYRDWLANSGVNDQ